MFSHGRSQIVRLIPKSNILSAITHFKITLSPKIQLNETAELKQLISFKFRNTKNIKVNFFKTGGYPKS